MWGMTFTFRYPDSELLMIGHHFTHREFEIIKLVESGLSSEEITTRLFISMKYCGYHRQEHFS